MSLLIFLSFTLCPTGLPPLRDNWFLWPLCQRNGLRSRVDDLKTLFTSRGWKRLPEFTLWWVLGQFVPLQIIFWALATSIPVVMLPHFGNRGELGICLFLWHDYAPVRSDENGLRHLVHCHIRGISSWDKRLIMIMYVSLLMSYTVFTVNYFILSDGYLYLTPKAYCFRSKEALTLDLWHIFVHG